MVGAVRLRNADKPAAHLDEVVVFICRIPVIVKDGAFVCKEHIAGIFVQRRGKDLFSPPDDGKRIARIPRDIKGEAAPPREVLFVGRFVYQKNLPFLLRAFARARQQREMRLTLAGDGADRDALLALSKELKTESSVRILPPCDPAPLYREADLLVLPSR